MAVIKRALISVSDKTGIVAFAEGLSRFGVEILSTGGTASMLREAGLEELRPADMSLEDFLARCHGFDPQMYGLVREFDGSVSAEHGIGLARLEILRALPELARRYFEESLPAGEKIRSPADTEAYLQAWLAPVKSAR